MHAPEIELHERGLCACNKSVSNSLTLFHILYSFRFRYSARPCSVWIPYIAPISGQKATPSVHRIHECQQSGLLRGCQAIPFIQHLTLRGSQSHTNVVLCKELRQCNTESIADLLKRCKRWRHRFFIPRGDGRLWQARAFSKLIFRPSPRLTILLDDFKNICHNFTTLDFSFIILWKIVAF